MIGHFNLWYYNSLAKSTRKLSAPKTNKKLDIATCRNERQKAISFSVRREKIQLVPSHAIRRISHLSIYAYLVLIERDRILDSVYGGFTISIMRICAPLVTVSLSEIMQNIRLLSVQKKVALIKKKTILLHIQRNVSWGKRSVAIYIPRHSFYFVSDSIL